MDLAKQVMEALKNAALNGYTFKGWTDEAIAKDLLIYDADIADSKFTLEEVTKEVAKYRKES